jgi:hypothetical protein
LPQPVKPGSHYRGLFGTPEEAAEKGPEMGAFEGFREAGAEEAAERGLDIGVFDISARQGLKPKPLLSGVYRHDSSHALLQSLLQQELFRSLLSPSLYFLAFVGTTEVVPLRVSA